MALKRIDGVENVDVSYELGRGTIVYDPDVTRPAVFVPAMEEMTGYAATVLADEAGGSAEPEGDTHDGHATASAEHAHDDRDDHR